MTYDAIEKSKFLGKPFTLFEFSRNGIFWRYTSADAAIVFQTHTFDPEVISRSSQRISGEDADSSLEIYVARDIGVASQFVDTSSPSPVWVSIWEGHHGEVETALPFEGKVGNVEFEDGLITMHCTPVEAVLRQKMPLRTYQKTCNHALYDAGCKVLEVAFKVSGGVSAINGAVVSVPEAALQPDGWYTTGIFNWGLYKTMIIEHEGVDLTLMKLPTGLTVGQGIQISAGCDRTIEICFSKFNNLNNFYGFPYVPSRNPFEGIQ